MAVQIDLCIPVRFQNGIEGLRGDIGEQNDLSALLQLPLQRVPGVSPLSGDRQVVIRLKYSAFFI